MNIFQKKALWVLYAIIAVALGGTLRYITGNVFRSPPQAEHPSVKAHSRPHAWSPIHSEAEIKATATAKPCDRTDYILGFVSPPFRIGTCRSGESRGTVDAHSVSRLRYHHRPPCPAENGSRKFLVWHCYSSMEQTPV